MKQPTITPVNSKYGAPMGRAAWNEPPTKPHSVRVFRVALDSGGYDQGGAYWGHGTPVYCATDCGGYRQFTRAKIRAAAIAEFRLPPFLLAQGIREHVQSMRETMAGYVASAMNYPAANTLETLTELGY